MWAKTLNNKHKIWTNILTNKSLFTQKYFDNNVITEYQSITEDGDIAGETSLYININVYKRISINV